MLDDDRIYSDYQDMAQKEVARTDGIEAVSTVTPNHLHVPIAKAFMDVGIDIISDKPLTTTLEEAQSLAKTQAKSGVIFGVTYAYSAHVMVRQVQAVVIWVIIGTHAEHLARFVSGLNIEPVRADFHVTGKPKAL